MPQTDINQVRLAGRLAELRQRWTPDGTLAVVGNLYLPRPGLGPVNKTVELNQPLPLRALKDSAELLLRYEGQRVDIQGKLRRRYYHRGGVAHWGQVEIWVDHCCPMQVQEENQ